MYYGVFDIYSGLNLSFNLWISMAYSKRSDKQHVPSIFQGKIIADIGVYVGLKHVNITLQAVGSNWTTDVDFNEHYNQMGNSFREALVRGLPFPILTVAEYFTIGQEGLAWGGQYRAAGYFATIMSSFTMWILMNLMLIVVPRYGALLMTTCGFLLLGTAWGYLCMLPESPLIIHLEGSTLYFTYGWCYWLVILAGGICLLSGVIITTIEIIHPHSFSTILEVDYDTPYDRHIIIEDSRGKRFQKKRNSNGSKLEEPEIAGIGSRILRRLSSKNREETHTSRSGNESEKHNFELESSPWRLSSKENASSRDDNFPCSTSQESVISYSRDIPHIHGFSRSNIAQISSLLVSLGIRYQIIVIQVLVMSSCDINRIYDIFLKALWNLLVCVSTRLDVALAAN
ncbi:hypothetical protein NQ317_000037 [Molorchus minor]|uniref:Dual oxidase maturation factor 1 n=1 Tax=Molorchus minor TaxID=1323400 RepID=A0ABQ9IUJ7_9CUCU|nr:hypothetical protein NQ317_000037 [Molorchus minor]